MKDRPLVTDKAATWTPLHFTKSALALAPDNFAAHHYYAHTLENLGRTKEALERDAPSTCDWRPMIPHAHHMHGHELLRAGTHGGGDSRVSESQGTGRELLQRENIPARYDWHHAHNLQLLALSYQSLGQIKSAEAMFRQTFAVPAYTEFLEYNRRAWPEFLMNRGRFAEALEAAQEMLKSPFPMAQLAGHTLAGQALLGMGRMNEAKDELTPAERKTEQLPVSR